MNSADLTIESSPTLQSSDVGFSKDKNLIIFQQGIGVESRYLMEHKKFTHIREQVGGKKKQDGNSGCDDERG